MVTRRRILKVTLLSGAAVAVAACTPEAVKTAGSGAPAASVAPTAAVAKPKRGGVLRVPDPSYGHLDMSIELVNAFALSGVYQTLLDYRANDYNDFALVPSLAEKWTVSADGKTVTLNLRKGVRWHNLPPVNGREFTSSDVAWNAQYYVKTSGFGYFWTPVASVETPDPYTAVLRLKEPSASFVAGLAHRNNFMLPREIFEADGSFRRRAIGTGPFMLKDYVPSERITLVKNPAYWEISEIDGQALPYLDGLESYAVKDDLSRLAGVRTGQFDMNTATGGNTAEEVKDFPSLGIRLVQGSAAFTRDLVLKYGNPKLADKRVRQAISYAINRDQWINIICGGQGVYEDWINIPGWAWTQEQMKSKLRYDVVKAKQLLADANAVGTQIKISGLKDSSAGLTAQGAEFLASELSSVGFKTEIELYPDTPTFRNVRIQPGTYDAILYVQTSFGADPTDYLGALASTSPVTVNTGAIKDPELDKLIAEQERAVDPAVRKATIDRIQEYILDQMYMVPLALPKVFKPLAARVKGPNIIHASQKATNVARVWIE